MGSQARRFVWFVLGIHLALFAGVLLIVYFASLRIRESVRAEAVDNARITQALLGKQTGTAIEGYYQSITKILEILRPLEVENAIEPTTQPATDPAYASSVSRITALRQRIGESLWIQLRDYVSLLFSVDRDAKRQIYPIGGSQMHSPADAVKLGEAWMKDIAAPSVSPVIRLNGVAGNLVGVPILGPDRLLVAFVPLSQVDSSLLADVNRRATLGGIVFDMQGTILCTSVPDLQGMNLFKQARDPRISEASQRAIDNGIGASEIFDNSIQAGGQNFPAIMLTFQPVKILDRTWWLAIGDTLDSVDEDINAVFTEAGRWALFVVVSVTAILVSTSVQLIRGRMRLERLRHSMLTKELREARHIQLAWLPDETDHIPGTDIAAINKPASHISGDFYNWFSLTDGRVVILIGDVAGHGMSAAFLMSTTQLLIRNTMQRVGDPGRCLEEVNRQLCGQLFNGQFVTILIMVLDVDHGHMDLASAGHPSPLMSDGGSYEPVPIDSQLALGILEDVAFTTDRLPLPQHASFFLYTDGAEEVMGSHGQQLGVEGLQRSLRPHSSSHDLLQAILHAVDRHRAGEALADDLTLVAVRIQRDAHVDAQATVALATAH